MRKANLFSVLISAVFFFLLLSCQKTEQSSEPLESAKNSHAVSYEQALQELNALLDDFDSQTRGGNRRIVADYYTSSVTSTRSDESDEDAPFVYIFNFENEEGFAIMSGDDRTTPVFAITESGNLHPGDTVNPGLGLFLGALEEYLVCYDDRDPGQPGEDETDEETDPNQPPPDSGWSYSYSNWTNNFYGTEINTRWGQDDPYNRLCPLKNGDSPHTGCVATAVAQIMCYYGYPNSYNGHTFNWNQMRNYISFWESFSFPEDIAYLMQQLGTSNNLKMDYGYGQKGSGALTSSVPPTLQNFGYSCDGVKDYSYAEILNEVIENRIVYVSGASHRIAHSFLGYIYDYSYEGGHAWVIDALLKRSCIVEAYYDGVLQSSSIYRENDLVHCNWGWDGTSNGYYYSGVFTANVGPMSVRSDVANNYKYELKMISGITPK